LQTLVPTLPSILVQVEAHKEKYVDCLVFRLILATQLLKSTMILANEFSRCYNHGFEIKKMKWFCVSFFDFFAPN
ncbi:hypothetical protein, partial [Staphylococcus nepalensis]|uniref:hypothetical protein n=1 Tax=Staphylococcus nepalensis TaxID=214473 RepID=UPI002855953D